MKHLFYLTFALLVACGGGSREVATPVPPVAPDQSPVQTIPYVPPPAPLPPAIPLEDLPPDVSPLWQLLDPKDVPTVPPCVIPQNTV